MNDINKTRQAIFAIANRLAYGEQYVEKVFRLAPSRSDREANIAASVATYLETVLNLLGPYYDHGDFIKSVNLGILDIDAIKYVDDVIGEAIEQELFSVQEEFASNSQARDDYQRQMMKNLEEMPSLNDAAALFNGLTNFFPHHVKLPSMTSDHLDDLAHNLHTLNEAFYYTHLGTEELEEKEMHGTLAGFKLGYLYISQAVNDLFTPDPQGMYPIHKNIKTQKFGLIQGGIKTPKAS